METLKFEERIKVNRLPKRGAYDTETIYNILDNSFVCHVAFKINDYPSIIPTAYGRKDDTVFIHGSKNNRMLNALKTEEDICISVTHTDGIVLARSAFHMSINYRSVIMYGKAEEINGNTEKTNALKIITDHIIPGRWNDIRKPTEKELYGTSVFSFRINEASAKIRTGPPVDDEEDLSMNIWAGILPFRLVTEEPVEDVKSFNEKPLPLYIKNYKSKL